MGFNACEEWSVGLSRCTRTSRIQADGSFIDGGVYFPLVEPTYYRDTSGNYPHFFDYVVQNVSDGNGSFFLELSHTEADTESEIRLNEFNYLPSSGLANKIKTFGGVSASIIDKVKFKVENERMIISVIKGAP